MRGVFMISDDVKIVIDSIVSAFEASCELYSSMSLVMVQNSNEAGIDAINYLLKESKKLSPISGLITGYVETLTELVTVPFTDKQFEGEKLTKEDIEILQSIATVAGSCVSVQAGGLVVLGGLLSRSVSVEFAGALAADSLPAIARLIETLGLSIEECQELQRKAIELLDNKWAAIS